MLKVWKEPLISNLPQSDSDEDRDITTARRAAEHSMKPKNGDGRWRTILTGQNPSEQMRNAEQKKEAKEQARQEHSQLAGKRRTRRFARSRRRITRRARSTPRIYTPRLLRGIIAMHRTWRCAPQVWNRQWSVSAHEKQQEASGWEDECQNKEARGRGVELRFKSNWKNCRIKEQDTQSEGVLGGTAASRKSLRWNAYRTRNVEEMPGKDIRNSEELNSQKQKQNQYQQSANQTLHAKMMDENNEIFKHDTEFPRIQDSFCSDPKLTTTIRKSVHHQRGLFWQVQQERKNVTNPQLGTSIVNTTPQMTRFRDAKVCNNWLQERIDDHRIQSDYKYKSELQNPEGKTSVLGITSAWWHRARHQWQRDHQGYCVCVVKPSTTPMTTWPPRPRTPSTQRTWTLTRECAVLLFVSQVRVVMIHTLHCMAQGCCACHLIHACDERFSRACALRRKGYGLFWRLLLPHRLWAQRLRPQGDLRQVLHRVPDPPAVLQARVHRGRWVRWHRTRGYASRSTPSTCLSLPARRLVCRSVVVCVRKNGATCWRANGATCYGKWSGAKRWKRTDLNSFGPTERANPGRTSGGN